MVRGVSGTPAGQMLSSDFLGPCYVIGCRLHAKRSGLLERHTVEPFLTMLIPGGERRSAIGNGVSDLSIASVYHQRAFFVCGAVAQGIPCSCDGFLLRAVDGGRLLRAILAHSPALSTGDYVKITPTHRYGPPKVVRDSILHPHPHKARRQQEAAGWRDPGGSANLD